MKRIILMALACLPAFVFAQDGKYTVEGTIGTYNAPAKIYLQYRFNGKVITDSTILKDGKFQFSGAIGNSPLKGNMRFNKNGTGMMSSNDYKQIFLEKGTITLIPDSLLQNQ